MLARGPILTALALLLLAACAGAPGGPVNAGDRLPALSAPALDGGPVDLAGEAGQAVWVSFWATWCAPCREEWPGVNAAARELGPGLRVVAVSVGEAPEAVAAFLAEHPADFAVALDPDAELAAQFGVAGLPTHILVGADGVVRHVVRGPLDGPRAAALLGLAAGPRPPHPPLAGGEQRNQVTDAP